jgi:hypothetical protein
MLLEICFLAKEFPTLAIVGDQEEMKDVAAIEIADGLVGAGIDEELRCLVVTK